MNRELENQRKKLEYQNNEKLKETANAVKDLKKLTILMGDSIKESNEDIKEGNSIFGQNMKNLGKSINQISDLFKSNIGSNLCYLLLSVIIIIIFLYIVNMF